MLLEYKSYRNDAVIEKLAVLLTSERSSRVRLNENINRLPEQLPVSTEQACSAEAPIRENPSAAKQSVAGTERHKRRISVVAIGAAVVCCILVGMLPKKNESISDQSEQPGASSDTISGAAEGLPVLVAEETTECTVIGQQPTEADRLMEAVEGQYFSISNSVYNRNSRDSFVNLFGYEPERCTKQLSIKDQYLHFNESDYAFELEDDVLVLEDTDFGRIDSQFIDVFHFNRITQGENYNSIDAENNAFFVFRLEDAQVDCIILCNQLNDLAYGTEEPASPDADETCIFSVVNTKRSGICLFEDSAGNTYLKSAYRNSVDEITAGSGERIREDADGRYDIVRISADGENDAYFFRKYDEQAVYMIQYIKYNVLHNGMQNAILRDEESVWEE